MCTGYGTTRQDRAEWSMPLTYILPAVRGRRVMAPGILQLSTWWEPVPTHRNPGALDKNRFCFSKQMCVLLDESRHPSCPRRTNEGPCTADLEDFLEILVALYGLLLSLAVRVNSYHEIRERGRLCY